MPRESTAPRAPEEDSPRGVAARARHLAVGLLLAALSVEGAAALGLLLAESSPPAAERERRALAAGELAPDAEGQVRTLDVVPHPYAGYVWSTAVDDKPGWLVHHQGHRVNAHGFMDSSEFLQRRDPGRVVVGITGGSVAWWLSSQGDRALAGRLHESPLFADKEVRFVRFAIGGYKQPQQLELLAYMLALGGELDVLVNLDGFNEVALTKDQNLDRGVYPFFPREWDLLISDLPDLETKRRVGRIVTLTDDRRDWAAAFDGALARRSPAHLLAWLLRDRSLERRLAQAKLELQSTPRDELPFVARGPGAEEFRDADVFAAVAEVWRRSSLQMDALCRANGIRYLHFLQPNQYVEGSKPMGEEEREVALAPPGPHGVRDGVRAGYPALVVAGERLVAAGVDFHDLRSVFEEVEEPLYIDPFCHVNARGSELLGARIGQAVLEALGGATEFRAFRPERWSVTLDRPGHPERLRPRGVFDDGRVYPVDPAGFEMRYESSAPDVVEVTSSGEVVGHRLGTAEVLITRAGRTAVVTVQAEWPAVLELDDGRAAEGEAPRLEALDEDPRVGGSPFHVRVRGAPGPTRGLLYVGVVPLIEAFERGEVAEDALFPLTAGADGERTAVLPIPDDPTLRGRAFHCQAVFLGPEEPGGPDQALAWSNSVVVTPR